MIKLVTFLILSAGTIFVSSQVVNNVHLVDFGTYFVNVMQEVMNEVERREWCNLKLDDITQNIDVTIYSWNVNGSVHFKNGFLTSLQSMDLTESTVQQVWGFSTADQTATVQVRGQLNVREAALGWDVDFTHLNGTVEHFTGVFTHELIQFLFAIDYNVDRNEVTTSVTLTSVSAGSRSMMFLPETPLTQVLQRQYAAWNNWDGVESWITQAFNPIFSDVVHNKIPFPELCYNCAT